MRQSLRFTVSYRIQIVQCLGSMKDTSAHKQHYKMKCLEAGCVPHSIELNLRRAAK